MLHLCIRISYLLRTERKSSPYLALHPGRGSGLLFTVQEDAEKEQNGQLDCQHDPLQAHHGEPSSLKITSKFCLRSLLERGWYQITPQGSPNDSGRKNNAENVIFSGWQHLPLTVQTGDVDGLGCPDRVPAAGAAIFSGTALLRLKVLASWAVGACS